MLDIVKHSLWTQFGASIDSLKNAIDMWPQAYWDTDTRFFYIAYHCLIMLDYYLTIPYTGELPTTLPFTFSEPGVQVKGVLGDMVPNRIYSKAEMLASLAATREKCRVFIEGLTDKKMRERWIEGPEAYDMNYAVPEILFYNMRHVQHHAAQLNMLLRQKLDQSPGWVFRADEN